MGRAAACDPPGAGLQAQAWALLKCSQEQTKLAGWGQRLKWTAVAWYRIFEHALFLGLMKTRLGFGPRGTRAEPKTVLCICSSFSNPYHCTTSSLQGHLKCFPHNSVKGPHFYRQHYCVCDAESRPCNHDPRVGKVNRRVDSHSWVFVHTFFFLRLLQLLAKSV